MRILVVEDNDRLARALVRGLNEAGHTTELAEDGHEALVRLETSTFEAVILDVMLPKVDGIRVLERIRRHGDMTPVLILSAKDDLESRIDGLDRGADDYLTKPFEFDELLARLRALVRRAQGSGGCSTIVLADLEVDIGDKQVHRAGVEIRLSRTEYALLECLAYRKGRPVARATLLEHLYDGDEHPSSNALEVHIASLRRKIDRGHASKLIHTRRGLGYILAESS